MANPVNWFEIYVAEMDRARDFYQKVFGKELMQLPSPDEVEMWAFPWVDGDPGSAGALVKDPQGQPGMGGTMVYISCDDVSNEIAKIKECGGTVLQEKMDIGEFGFIAIFQDTEGNAVGLHNEN